MTATIIIYDNTIRRTKIARGFEFMNRISELLACDAELVANVFGRIFPPVPNDASHTQVYSSHADQSLSDGAFRQSAKFYSNAVNSTPCLE
jgi:hypothetical protein